MAAGRFSTFRLVSSSRLHGGSQAGKPVPHSVRRDRDVVDPSALFLRGEAVEARRAVDVGGFVRDFDGPGFGLGLVFFPRFRAYYSAAVGGEIDACFQAIPDIR